MNDEKQLEKEALRIKRSLQIQLTLMPAVWVGCALFCWYLILK